MSLVIVGASPNIARAAQTLDAPLIFVQSPGTHVSWELRDGRDNLFRLEFQNHSLLRSFAEVLRPHDPKAVVSVTEDGLEPAAFLAELLNLPATPPQVVTSMRDKLRMRRLLAVGAPHLNVAYADPLDEDSVRHLFSCHSKVIAKPVGGTGSRHIQFLTRPEEFQEAPDRAGYILEAFIEGKEYSVESFSRDGHHEVIAIAETGTVANFMEVSHIMPPVDLSDGRSALIKKSVGELLDSLGLTDGPAHTELKVDGDTVRIIETHNRPGGGGIAELVQLTTGIDWRRVSLGWPLGIRPEGGTPRAPAAASVLFTAHPGKVRAILDRPEPSIDTALEHWRVTVNVGDTVRELRSAMDRVGGAIVSGQTPAACALATKEILACPVVTTESHAPTQ